MAPVFIFHITYVWGASSYLVSFSYGRKPKASGSSAAAAAYTVRTAIVQLTATMVSEHRNAGAGPTTALLLLYVGRGCFILRAQARRAVRGRALSNNISDSQDDIIIVALHRALFLNGAK